MSHEGYPRLIYDLEPSPRQRARAVRQSLRYLEQEARDAGLAFVAHLIGVAAYAASEEEKKQT